MNTVLETNKVAPERGTTVTATNHAGSPVGLYVGRSPSGIDWVCWPAINETQPSRDTFAAMCAAFDRMSNPSKPSRPLRWLVILFSHCREKSVSIEFRRSSRAHARKDAAWLRGRVEPGETVKVFSREEWKKQQEWERQQECYWDD
jgi:hypothetical protein